MKTWKLEMLVVFVALVAVVWLKGGGWLELVGALAVLAAFGNAQVTFRMAEREGQKPKPDVHCHAWAGRYFLAKELLWIAYFVAHKSWAALVGAAVFLLYPIWRVWWRKRHPLKVEEPKLEVPPSFVRPKPAPPPLDTLVLDGHPYQALEGTILTPGSPNSSWVLRAKLLLKPGDTERVESLIRLRAVVQATLKRDGGDASHGEATTQRGSCFRDREGRNCASLELIGTGELKHV